MRADGESIMSHFGKEIASICALAAAMLCVAMVSLCSYRQRQMGGSHAAAGEMRHHHTILIQNIDGYKLRLRV
jgi:hypothetical protein